MYFCHSNGFYSCGQYLPREMAVCRVSRFPETVDFRMTVDLFPLVTTSRDDRANEYATRRVHKLWEPRIREGELFGERFYADRLQKFARGLEDAVFVAKGANQVRFFEACGLRVRNIDGPVKKMDDLLAQTRHAPSVPGCHARFHVGGDLSRCSYVISGTVAHALSDLFGEE